MTYTLRFRLPHLPWSPKTRFLTLFLFFSLALFAFFYANQSFFTFTLTGTAQILAAIMSLFGIHSTVTGSLVTFPNVTFDIIYECTALFPAFLFLAAVTAYPASLRHTLLGIAIGLPALYALNILRLVILSIIGMQQPAAFQFVHSFLWQSTFLIFVILLFVFWTRREVTAHGNA